jgi:hypothetical protein
MVIKQRKRDGDRIMDNRHSRPSGVNDDTVEAVGKVTEAVEWIERARGHLYDFHQMMGHADLLLGEAAEALEQAGHEGQARNLITEIVGRNVLEGRWTYQVVEEFDDHYYEPVRRTERSIRESLMCGRRHVFEAEMKERRRSVGHPFHTSQPGDRSAD